MRFPTLPTLPLLSPTARFFTSNITDVTMAIASVIGISQRVLEYHGFFGDYCVHSGYTYLATRIGGRKIGFIAALSNVGYEHLQNERMIKGVYDGFDITSGNAGMVAGTVIIILCGRMVEYTIENKYFRWLN